MPTYVYEAVQPADGCELCRTRFELHQSIHDAALTHCPQCRASIVRLITSVGICTQPSERAMLSDRNLKAKGFTKLVKEGDGKYRRVT
jgi:putative FmdB family regulatory protein